MRSLSFSAAACGAALALVAASVARADQAAPGSPPGAWHYRSVTCVDTTVKSVEPRISDGSHGAAAQAALFKSSGVVVTFDSGLGLRPLFATQNASVVHYEATAGNDVMQAEKPGDKVQLCFLGGPSPTVGLGSEPGCDPDTDSRGRQYRVWDYATSKQYIGSNAEHLCGGA